MAKASARRAILPRLVAFARREWLLLLIIALGIAVRVWRFGSVPGGFNQDEATTAADALSLLFHGVERRGFGFPVMLPGWGGGHMGSLPAVLAMPFLFVLGHTVIGARAASLAVNLALLAVFPLFCREVWDRRFAQIGAFLLAVAPWHIMASRWGIEYNFLPAWILFATFALSRSAVDKHRPFLLGCALLTTSVYVYGPALFFAPVFLACATFILWRGKRVSGLTVLDGVLLSTVLALPMALFLLVNQWHLASIRLPVLSVPLLTGTPHYATMSVFFGSGGWQMLQDNARALWSLLITQHDGLLWNSLPGFGMGYLWATGLSLVGFLVWIGFPRAGKPSSAHLITAWTLTGVLLGLVMTPNSNRINVLFLPLTFFAAVCVRALADRRTVLWGCMGAYAISFVLFTQAYFTSFATDIAPQFFEGLGPALQEAARIPGTLCISGSVNMPYVSALFFNAEDPREFARTVHYDNPGAEFESVSSFGRYVFGMGECARHPEAAGFVLRDGETAPFPVEILKRFGTFAVAKRAR